MRDDRIMDVADVVAWEQRLAEEGTSLLELMNRAGHAVAQAAMGMVASGSSIVILCGSGNNGGDGWVAAGELASAGYAVTLVTKRPAGDIAAHPAHEAAIEAEGRGGFEILLDPSQEALMRVLADAALVIDAILGTGFSHAQVRAPYDGWIRAALAAHAEQGVPILAVDCPSGLNAQTGSAAADCIAADKTVTMLAVKTGLVQPHAAGCVGELVLAPLAH